MVTQPGYVSWGYFFTFFFFFYSVPEPSMLTMTTNNSRLVDHCPLCPSLLYGHRKPFKLMPKSLIWWTTYRSITFRTLTSRKVLKGIYRARSGPNPKTPNILMLPQAKIIRFHLYGEDARNDGAGDANGLTVLHELDKGFWAEKKLCNDEVCPSKNFLLEVLQVCLIALCFRMALWVAFGRGEEKKTKAKPWWSRQCNRN